ncbi:MAG: efflux RND transporter permease subunit, partial [Bdellovibrio sp.]
MLIVLALIVGGIYSFKRLPIEAFPDVLNETVQVITLAPGLSARDVEKQITIPLEREFSGLPRLETSRSISEFGLSVVYLSFEEGVDRFWARTQTLEKISVAEISEKFQPRLAPLASVTGEILRYEVKGTGMNGTELRTLQEWSLEKLFRSVPGVADVTSFGGKVRAWDLIIEPDRLANYGITIRQLVEAVAGANKNSAGNLIEYPNQAFVVRSIGLFQKRSDIEEIILPSRGSGNVRVRDLGRVVEGYMPPRGIVGRDQRDDIVQGIVLLRKGENPVLVGQALRKKIQELSTENILPEGVRLDVFYDRIQLVEKTTSTVVDNLFHGFLFVVFILYLFLRNIWATALVAAVVPLSLFCAFLLIWLTGTPANLISLGAIDFGIIVDGAVIITEYVLANFERLHGNAEAIERGLKNIAATISEVIQPVFVSMVLIIVAYLPIFTLQSVEGKTFRPLAWTITFALIGALVLGLTFVPTFLPKVISLSMKKAHHEAGWLKYLRLKYFHTLSVFMNSPRKIFALAAVLAAIGVTSFLFMGTEFLPELDEGALWIRARFPQSMNLKKGTELAHNIRSVLKEQDEVRTVVSQLGGPEDGTDPNLFDNCEFFVDLKPKSEWSRFDHDRNRLIVGYRELLEEFYGIEFNVSQPIADNVEEAVSGVKGKNAVKIFGLDLAVLISLSQKIQNELKKIPGLVDVGIIASMPQVPHLSVRPNREKIAQLGLTSQDVNDLIEIAVGGAPISTVALNEQRIDLIMRSPEALRKSREDLKALPLLNSKGVRLRLDQVAQVEFDNDPLAIFREKMNRRIGVKFNIEGRDLGSAMKDVQKLIQAIEIPPGYRIELGGESQSQKRA